MREKGEAGREAEIICFIIIFDKSFLAVSGDYFVILHLLTYKTTRRIH